MSTHLLLNEKPLMVLPSLAKLLGINASIAVQQIHWIIEIKHENQDDRTDYDGYTWCKYTLKQWQAKLAWMTVDGIHKMLAKLEADKVIVSCKPDAKSKNQTKWYRVNYDGLNRLSTKSISDSVQNVISDSVQNVISDSVQNDLYKKDSKDYKKSKKNSFDSKNESLLSEVKKEGRVLENKSEDPKTPPPPTPAAPFAKNYAQEMSDRFNSREPSRKKQTEPLTKDDDFLKYLFAELRKTKSYFRDIQDKNDLTPVRGFIRKCWLIGSEGDVRFAEIQDYLISYEKHKQAQNQRSLPQPAPQPLELVASPPPKHLREKFRAS